jgi:hypothetical protein
LNCGKHSPPVPFAELLDLENEKLYAEFHQNVLTLYEKILLALDVKSQFMFPPVIVDPVALAVALQIDVPTLKFPDDYLIYGFGLPLIATKLGFTLPSDLALKLPSVIVPSPPIPKLPKLDIQLPEFQDLFNFSAFPLRLPNVFLNLITSMPSLFAGLLQFNFNSVCGAVNGAKIFGAIPPGADTLSTVVNVLIRKTVEALVIAIVAGSVGSASGGVVGALGQKFGYVPPKGDDAKEPDPRVATIKSAQTMIGKSFSSEPDAYVGYLYSLETGNGSAEEVDGVKQCVSNINAGIPFARATMLRAGASTAYFTTAHSDEDLSSIAKFQQAVNGFERKGQFIPGDILIIQEQSGEYRSLVVTQETFENGSKVSTVVEAGVLDDGNEGQRTAIGEARYTVIGNNIVRLGEVRENMSVIAVYNVMKIVS